MLASSIFDRRQQAYAALFVAVLATFFAALRAAESLAHLTSLDWPAVLSALRWRIWDWWFWIPVALVVWSNTSSRARLRRISWRTLPFHLGLAITLLFVHRVWSLLGMLLFHPGAAWSMHTAGELFTIAPSQAITDLLTWSALVAGCIAGRTTLERRERLARRRHNRVPVPLRKADNAANAQPKAAVAELIPAPTPATLPLKRLLVRIGRRQQLINIADVTWFEADGYCTRLHTEQGTTHVVRLTMAHLEKSVDPVSFVRAHRSALVNVSRICELRTTNDGSHILRLSDDQQVPVSRARYGALRRRLADIPVSA